MLNCRTMLLRCTMSVCAIAAFTTDTLLAQSVCLPAPRLLTTMPMGGRAGTTLEVQVTGESLEQVDQLRFSHPGITAKPKLDANGLPIKDTYEVTIADDCPAGIHQARLMTRLGVSSSRVFNVSRMKEVTRSGSNTTLETAVPLEVNTICNGYVTNRAIDYYRFEAEAGQRIVIDCAAKGIDSKLTPVIVLADESGQDLIAERRGGVIDYTTEAAGTYHIKVHDLTYNGGAYHFYRLSLQSMEGDEPAVRMASTNAVNSISWPAAGYSEEDAMAEVEDAAVQRISLPASISGRFFPAADVDTFEFEAKQGDVWWIEVASERLGRPTDPALLVQHVANPGPEEVLTDVVELSDIPSPVKVSSNGYSYDGPPYNVGSTDILGKLEIKQDGLHRLKLTDLFGGTRNEPRNEYRLVIREAKPDFAIAAWGLHMQLRNGDRNALSKPIALRQGATIPLEVVVVRKDGFTGPIELFMDNLPEGVSAQGLTIPAGQSRGIMLITAAGDAPRGLTSANFYGQATINDEIVQRQCHLASMAWPVRNAWSEIPAPRLVADVPVSVSEDEGAPITITPEHSVIEAKVGEKVTIPLKHTIRSEFSGPKISLKTFGAGFEQVPDFDASLTEDHSEATLDLTALKTKPGEYVIAFYGTAVAKYRYNPAAIPLADAAVKVAEQELAKLSGEVAELKKAIETAEGEAAKAEAQKEYDAALNQQQVAQKVLTTAQNKLKSTMKAAEPKDIADIVVSEPIRLRVLPAEDSASEKVAQQ